MKTWEVNGISLDIDLSDADCMERVENAFEKMKNSESVLKKDGKQSERIRAYCGLFRTLFSDIFGEDDADRIFKDIPTSTTEYERIYVSFLDTVRAQTEEVRQSRADMISKYIPKNRKQRRAVRK